MNDQFDVVVLGMGPGGEEVAGRLAEAGLSVVGIEANLLGGECPYWGCIPSKMMVRAANLLAEAGRIDGMAGTVNVLPDWAPIAKRIREEATDNWDDRVAVERFEGKGGTFVRGQGRIVGPRSVEVEGRRFEASRALVISTGMAPTVPPIAGLGDVDFWTNRDAVQVEELPESLTVIGGGAIGAELAQVFARFGVRVTVIEALDRLLAAEEPEASRVVEGVFTREGIDVRTRARISEILRSGDGIQVRLEDGGVITSARLLVTAGRTAKLDRLGVDAAGLDANATSINVDERLRAGDGIYAIGDVTGEGAFTHVAMYQARIAVADILGMPAAPADYHALPRVTFTDPEVGSVGMTESAARGAGLDVATVTKPVASTARGWMHKAGNDGVIKLVVDRRAGILVGAASVGPHGGEVLGLLTLAVHARVPIEQLRTMIYAYPTFHRGVEDAISELRL